MVKPIMLLQLIEMFTYPPDILFSRNSYVVAPMCTSWNICVEKHGFLNCFNTDYM